MLQAWLYLIAAILTEVCGTTSMKLSQGFTRLVPSIAIFVFYILSFVFLTLALKKIDLGVSYAVWAGLGTACVAVIGVVYFDESINAMKVASIGLVVLGVVGLHLSSGTT